jgi:hypothetical protein
MKAGFFGAVALVTALASPAFAAHHIRHQDIRAHQITRQHYVRTERHRDWRAAYGLQPDAFAYAPWLLNPKYGPQGVGCNRPHSPNPQWDVCWPNASTGTTYRGSDPDPRVREQLLWDSSGSS